MMNLKDRFRSNQLPFWLLTIGLGMVLILPKLIMDGMFMDGVLYASVSHNLAQGIGTWWFLKFSELGFSEFTTFHEHPPLVFWIQSIFYRIFGSSMYVERGYSFLTAIITALLMVRTWRLVTSDNEKLSKLSWTPVFLWLLIPVVFWSYQNNVQENTMGIFTLLAVIFSIQAVHLGNKIYLNLILAGAMIFCASFSKGVPGFFPLGVIFFHWILFRKQSFGKMVWYSGILILVPAIIYGLLLLVPAARESLSIYTFERLFGRIDSAPTEKHHYYILARLFMEILPLIIIAFITLVIYKIKKIDPKLDKGKYRMIAFFVLLGLSGSVPVMLTLVQKTFYIAACFPFFGIAFALLIGPGIADRIARIKRTSIGFKLFTVFSSAIVVGAVVVTILQIGKISRNKDVLHDIYIVEEIIPHYSTINVHPSMWNQWDAHCYMIRFYNISWDQHEESQRDFFLMDKSFGLAPDSTYRMLDLPTKKFDLYQRTTN